MAKYKRIAPIELNGGQGEVWLGEDTDGNAVAIKYVKLPVAIEDAGLELKRFAREIRCQQSLSHPGIVQVLGSNMKSDTPFYVMPRADGSLRSVLAIHVDGLPEDEAIVLMLKVLDAMAYAHRKGNLHRDLKPENILMYGGEPAVSDFGLVRRLQSGSTTITLAQVGLGTIQYSAPEQFIDGHSVDATADVYSLGCILYELLTGRSPFPRVDLQAVPDRFRHIVFMATRFEPEHRYRSVADMTQDIQTVVNGFDSLRSPVDRAQSIFDAVDADEASKNDIAALSRLLIEFSADVELYNEFVRRSDNELMMRLRKVSKDSFEQVVLALDAYASQRFDFEFSDLVGDALASVYWTTDDIGIRTVVIRRMMLLACSHNRYHVRDAAADIIADAIRDRTWVQIVAGLLRDNPEVRDFIGYRLRDRSLPKQISELLNAAVA